MKCLNFNLLFLALGLIHTVKSELDFTYSCKEKKTIALTFDDGPHKYTKELVDYLVDEHPDVKVTFFHVAKFHYPYATDVSKYQRAMKKAHDNGFQIASHTYEHKISSDMDEFKKSLNKMDDFIEEVTGDRPRYFRAPKGHCNTECKESLEEWGYHLIQWDTDTNDWDLETSGSVEQRIEDSVKFLKKEFAKEKDSYLILMHDSESYTVRDIAPWILERSGMKEKGYRFVTVAECLGHKDGMYRSGKTYEKKAPTMSNYHNTTINDDGNVNSTLISNNNIEHNLDLGSSNANMIQPISFLTYLSLGLMGLFLYLLN